MAGWAVVTWESAEQAQPPQRSSLEQYLQQGGPLWGHPRAGPPPTPEYPLLNLRGQRSSSRRELRDELLNGEIFYSLAEAAVLVEQWRREYNTVRPHSACGGFPPAPEAIKPSPWFLRMPVLHGPPRLLGLT